jgi:hypothetical protein
VLTLLCGECGNRTCASAASYVLIRHVYLCTQHTDVGTVRYVHWLIDNGITLIRLTSWGYNRTNSTECADSGSRAMKNKIRDVHQPNSVCKSKKADQIKTMFPTAVQCGVLGHVVAWVFDVWIENEMTCTDNVRASCTLRTNRIFLLWPQNSCSSSRPVEALQVFGGGEWRNREILTWRLICLSFGGVIIKKVKKVSQWVLKNNIFYL